MNTYRLGQPDPVLRRLESVFDECGFVVPQDARNRATEVAASLLGPSDADPASVGIAQLAFATELFGALGVELASQPLALASLIDVIETDAGISRIALGRDVLRTPGLLQLPSAVAVEVQLALLLAFMRAEAVSVWTLWPGGDLRQISHAGDFQLDMQPTRQLARELLVAGTPPQASKGLLSAMVVERWQQPSAALVARFGASPAREQRALLGAAAPMLATMLERDLVVGRRTTSEQAIVAATERRLARLRFDLHDGPQQDLIMLADDLRLFREQLETVVDGNPAATRIVGRLDDLQARLIALDGDLRRITAIAQAPIRDAEPLADALTQLADSLSSRSGIETDVRLRGTLTELSDSQHIALLALIREALNNAREHSEASHVTVEVHGGPDEIVARVTDNGRGFDPERTLVRAAREGHLGLVGMYERMRLLGGRTTIDSRPGGPTVISVTLPTGTAVAPPRPPSDPG